MRGRPAGYTGCVHFRPLTEPAQHWLRGTAEPGHTTVAVDRGEIVGGVTVASRELTVPGAVVPVAEVAAVSPAPRWLQEALMSRQLTELYESGETVAAGTAVCGRFGFGPAARAVRLQAAGGIGLDASTSRIRLVEAAAAGPLLEPLYDAVRPRSVGFVSRPPRFWDALPGSAAVHSSPEGEVTGYALYRTGDRGEAQVAEVVASTPQAAAILWRFLLAELGRLSALVPVDSPLLRMVTAPRLTPVDNLWVRLVDVERALAVRRYATPLDVVLSVCDSFCPWNTGRFRLRAEGGRVTCSRTSAPAELCVSAADLGAAYLGGPPLAEAGRVVELRPGALSRTSLAFRGQHEPFHPAEAW
ncbi:UPF0256 protein [Amycolatopsis deserti]|uniref:UPF0256 protein n=1 Tax=Amycolatopsis deserti TaxID=185696 RepID=A0ABQ3JGV0_9PSEU|nr:GNAT family N-acetyltransferase [Amycolatopsis deserti]GHF29226.1 UPF0256 protein [Amycolatopsis deserti]